jgi:hypothetical protein
MQRFDQVITGGPHAGKTVIQSAQLQGDNMTFDAANLDAASGPRILGLFNAGNMSLKWTGLIAEPSPDSGLPTGQSCVENQRPANEPSLAAMTSKAIDLLHEDDGPGPWRSHDDNFGHRRSRGLPRERTLFRVFRQLPDGSRAPACGRRLRSALRSSRSENRVPPARPRTSRRGS